MQQCTRDSSGLRLLEWRLAAHGVRRRGRPRHKFELALPSTSYLLPATVSFSIAQLPDYAITQLLHSERPQPRTISRAPPGAGSSEQRAGLAPPPKPPTATERPRPINTV